MLVQLIFDDADQKGQVIPITIPSFTIGQGEDCNLRSVSPGVSPLHCMINIEKDIVSIQDMNSVLGTTVNGERIVFSKVLKNGDRIVVGKLAFVVSLRVPKEPESEPEDDSELLFEIKVEGQKLSVTRNRLLRLAKKGEISPDDIITVCGTKVFADSIEGIVFGDKSTEKPTKLPPAAPREPTSDAVQDSFSTKSETDFNVTASGIYGFFKEELESEPALPLKTGSENSKADAADPFGIQDEPSAMMARPSKTEKNVSSEIGEKIAPSSEKVGASTSNDGTEQNKKYFPYIFGTLCLLGLSSAILLWGISSSSKSEWVQQMPSFSPIQPEKEKPAISVISKPQETPKGTKKSAPPIVKTTCKDIFEAITRGTIADVKYFVDQKIDLNAKNSSGLAPLFFAIDNNAAMDIVQALVSGGADINAQGPSGNTPLHRVVSDPFFYPEKYEIMRFLLYLGADVNAKNDSGESPLSRVIASPSLQPDKVKFLTYLASHGAEVNVNNQAGDTPLHCLAASHLNTLDAIMYFISRDADVNAEDGKGRTALDVANTDEKRAILRAAGAVERTAPSEDLTKVNLEDIPNVSASLPAEMQYNIGLNFYFGTKEIPQDKVEALRWFRAAAEQGHAEGQFRVGTYHYFGWEIPKNEAEAINWLKKAEEQGNEEASGLLRYIERHKEIFESSSNDV